MLDNRKAMCYNWPMNNHAVPLVDFQLHPGVEVSHRSLDYIPENLIRKLVYDIPPDQDIITLEMLLNNGQTLFLSAGSKFGGDGSRLYTVDRVRLN